VSAKFEDEDAKPEEGEEPKADDAVSNGADAAVDAQLAAKVDELRDRFYETTLRPEKSFSDLIAAKNFGQIFQPKTTQ
jgi:hypothetical protein